MIVWLGSLIVVFLGIPVALYFIIKALFRDAKLPLTLLGFVCIGVGVLIIGLILNGAGRLEGTADVGIIFIPFGVVALIAGFVILRAAGFFKKRS